MHKALLYTDTYRTIHTPGAFWSVDLDILGQCATLILTASKQAS